MRTINEERAEKVLVSLRGGEELRLLTNPYNTGVIRIDIMDGEGAEPQCFLEQCHRGYKKALKLLRDSGKVTIEEEGRFW